MNSVLNFSSYLKKTWASVLFFTLFLWFSVHIVNGDRGYFSYVTAKSDASVVADDHARLKAERIALENRVQNLRSASIDTDLLDEQSRHMLGQLADDEFVLPNM